MRHRHDDPLARLLSSEISQRAQNRHDRTAPPALLREILRRRALRNGSFAATAVVVLAAVVVGGVSLTDRAAHPTPPTMSPTPDLALSDRLWGETVVTLPSATMAGPDFGSEIYSGLCGAPVPRSAGSDRLLDSTFSVSDHIELIRSLGSDRGPSGSAFSTESVAFTPRGDQRLPAFVDGPVALFTQDGVVVGLAPSWAEPTVTTFVPGEATEFRWMWSDWVEGCADDGDEPSDDGLGALPAGEYEVYFAARAHNSEERASLWSLNEEGYSLPSALDIEAFQEGSYRCSSSENLAYRPVTCEPGAVIGVAIDPGSGTATVPYERQYFTHEVDEWHVSPAVTVFLSDDEGTAAATTAEIPSLKPGTSPACGEVYASGFEGGVVGGWAGSLSSLAPGATTATELWHPYLGWSSGSVRVPQNVRVWLGKEGLYDVEIDHGGTSMTQPFSGTQIIGWFDAVSAQTSIDLSAYQGPSLWPLTVTDVQWCEGHDISDIGPGTEAVTGVVAGVVVTRLDNGTVTQEPFTFIQESL